MGCLDNSLSNATMTTIMSIDLDDYLPSVADFPRPGVVFRDICPLLADADAFAAAIDSMAATVADWRVDRIAGIESRGLIFGAALALKLHKPLVPVRKPGKLPPPTVRTGYALEYGSDALEMQQSSLRAGEHVLLVDDVIATGGTLLAAAALVRRLGAVVSGVVALLAIGPLGGSEKLQQAGIDARALLRS
jgi:adenine phosphoribosyltransferase